MLISWLNSSRIRVETDDLKSFSLLSFSIGGIMHNLISYNQLAGSYEDEQDTLLTEYYECLIECDDDQATCKRICREVLQ